MPRAGSHTRHLTTDERQRVRTLYFDAHFSPTQIAAATGYTVSQIRYTCRAESAAVAVRSGRPAVLNEDEIESLINYIRGSKEGRQASYLKLSQVVFNGSYGHSAIRNTLRRLGYKRYVARRKPPISEKNRLFRLQWAQERLSWTIDDWKKILWTDETWITGGTHRKGWVTRLPGEEWEDSCVIYRHQRKGGWMFWGSFHGTKKGPGVFWEKDWGKINAESYQQHIVPVIDGWIRLRQATNGDNLTLMQDGAPGHSAADTLADLADRGIRVLVWPPYSPDLNPIERVWCWMKDYIEDKYGLVDKPSYDQLRRWVKEAWDALEEYQFEELLATMPDRCAAVVAAEGQHTKY